MDPLSITAAIVGMGAVAASTSRAFKELRELCKTLPGRLHALSNEVSDIELVLYQVASVVERRTGGLALKDLEAHIQHLLDQAGSKLVELRTIVETLTGIVRTTKIPIFRAHAWRKNQPRLQGLQDDIKTVKCSLNIMLGASNSQDMMRIRVDLETISTVSSNSAQIQLNMEENLQSSLVRHRDDLTEFLTHVYQQVDQRIGNVEELLKVQAAQMQASQLNQLGNSYGGRSSYSKPLPPARKKTQHQESKSTEGVGMRVTQHGVCRPGCPCRCHVQTRSSTWGLVDRVFGQMFVGYAGLPLVNAKCDTNSCEKNQSACVSVEYWFPLGFVWSKILRLQLTYQPHIGPQFELSTLRRVPDSAQCVNFALNGNIDGLKDLFKKGLASPRDVSTTRGYSVLRWAMYGKQYQTCKFLFNAGADPDYRPIAASDNSPRNKAHQFLLMGGLSDDDVEALRCLTRGDDFVGEQNYTTLHRIILGLSMANLEEEICLHPEDVNTSDVMGRTPLAWAACRGDDRAIVTLLSHGAEVNTLDIQRSGVVGHAADRSYVTCVRLLLEAGADPDIASAHGYEVGNPLNVAARNASDPLVLKTLLDFGANVESSGIDGMTALIHASRRDNASFATLLLEYGANINATSTVGQTPLTTAVAFNSHNVLRLLLDRWFEYSECPRLTGPHLLQIVAHYADIETISILTNTNHLHLKYDSSYALGDFKCRLSERLDVTEKLIFAFDGLMDIIEQGPASPGHYGIEGIMESGLVHSDAGDSDGEVFENAMESLYLEKEPVKQGDRPTICRFKSRTF
ncbi:hypothetical protein MMC28_007235 [Mycoblastus sanguinarius]|nr:hypothetical protein [Mycoblastus sanguinarius]